MNVEGVVRIGCGDLSVRLGDRLVVDGVSFEVRGGEWLGLIGPNGAGKTTLLRSLLGLVPIAGGTVTVEAPGPAAARGRGGGSLVGYVPQRHEFAWDFPVTVAGAVMSARARRIGWMRRPGRADREAVDAALRTVGLDALRDQPLHRCSGGQRQRVLFARALALQPRLLLLDEPFTGVDVATQATLVDLLRRRVAEGDAVVMTTHDLVSARDVCTRLLLLNRSVVAEGTPEALDDPEVWLRAFGVTLPGSASAHALRPGPEPTTRAALGVVAR